MHQVLNAQNYLFNPFATAGLLSSYLILALCVFILLEKRRTKHSTTFALGCITAFIWQFGFSLMHLSKEADVAIVWARFSYAGIIFLPALFYHFSLLFSGTDAHRGHLRGAYLAALSFSVLCFSPFFFDSPSAYFSGFYPRASWAYHPFVVYFMTCMIGALVHLRRTANSASSPRMKIQAHYLLLALLVLCLGAIDFLPAYGVNVYPVGYLPIVAFVVITAFAISRFRLFNIDLVLGKGIVNLGLIAFIFAYCYATVNVFKWLTGESVDARLGFLIFIGTYCLMVGAGRIRTILHKTVQKYVYRNRFEYHNVLSDAIKVMVTMLDLDELLNYIVTTIGTTLDVSKVQLFLRDGHDGTFRFKGVSLDDVNGPEALPGSHLVEWLERERTVLTREALERTVEEKQGSIAIATEMTALKAEVCVPLIYKGNLTGILTLSERESLHFYSQDDLDLLSALGAEAAVALENARLYEEAINDGLTRLYHQKHFKQRLMEELARCLRHHHPVSLLMIDIDDFKAINDHYGHPSGDNVLRELGKILKNETRINDICARYGGEEFSAVLCETGHTSALAVAERLRRCIEETRFTKRALRITVSVGIATYENVPRDATPEDFIALADKELYRAKLAGKNRVSPSLILDPV